MARVSIPIKPTQPSVDIQQQALQPGFPTEIRHPKMIHADARERLSRLVTKAPSATTDPTVSTAMWRWGRLAYRWSRVSRKINLCQIFNETPGASGQNPAIARRATAGSQLHAHLVYNRSRRAYGRHSLLAAQDTDAVD